MKENKLYVFTEYDMYLPTSEKTHICIAPNVDTAIKIILRKLKYYSPEKYFEVIYYQIQEFGLDSGYIDYKPIYQ